MLLYGGHSLYYSCYLPPATPKPTHLFSKHKKRQESVQWPGALWGFADFAKSPLFIPCTQLNLRSPYVKHFAFHSVAVYQTNANSILSVLTLPKNSRKGDCKNVNGTTSEGFPLQRNPPDKYYHCFHVASCNYGSIKGTLWNPH